MINLTDNNFEEIVLNNEKPVIVDFWAEWCGPCRVIGPIVESMSEQYSDVVFGKMNVDSNFNTSAKYGIRNIPTLLFFKNGEIADRVVGALPAATLASKIDAFLKQ